MRRKIILAMVFVTLGCSRTVISAGDGATISSSVFAADISINNIYLYDAFSVEGELGDLMPFVDKEEDLPSVVIATSGGQEYFKLVFFPGSERNNFSIFEVGNLSANLRPVKFVEKEQFFTESGIRLGMSQKDIVRIKGNNYKESIENGLEKIRYEISDEGSSVLKRYRMPKYFADYFFNEAKELVKFSFGFEYP